MELSSREILERMDRFVKSAKKIKVLKDYLLTFRFFGDDKEWLAGEQKRHDEAIKEIERIYQEEMLSLIEGVVEYLASHRKDLEELSRAA